MTREKNTVCATFQATAAVEKVRRHKLLDIGWEPGGDELTPTMKLKRRPIAEKCAEDKDALCERERG